MNTLLLILLNEFGSDMLVASIIGVFISCLILGITIATAIRVNKRDRIMTAQLKILCKIAIKNGVNEQEVIDIYETIIK